MREDRVRYPRGECGNADFILSFDLNSGFETRMAPFSNLGSGWSSALKKTINICSGLLMEARDDTDFEDIRREVFGITTDQGAEKAINDTTVNILPKFRDRYASNNPLSWLWPFALFIAGHMHVLYNALEEACKSITVAKTFSTT